MEDDMSLDTVIFPPFLQIVSRLVVYRNNTGKILSPPADALSSKRAGQYRGAIYSVQTHSSRTNRATCRHICLSRKLREAFPPFPVTHALDSS